MISKQIRKDVKVKKKNETHNKLVCEVLLKNGKLYIAIKNKGFQEASLIDIEELLDPYVDIDLIKEVGISASSYYEKEKIK